MHGTPVHGTLLLAVGSSAAADQRYPLPITWWLPERQTRSGRLVWLQHGFARNPRHLGRLAQALAGAGHVVAAPRLPSNPVPVALPETARRTPALRGVSVNNVVDNRPLLGSLSAQLAAVDEPEAPLLATLAADLQASDLVLVGHSAGAEAVTWIGGQLAHRWGRPPAAVILLDPVPSPRGNNLVEGLQHLTTVPLRVVAARASAANRHGLGTAIVCDHRTGEVGLRLERGTHADAEGPDPDLLTRASCGTPHEAEVAALRDLVVAWATDPGLAPSALAASRLAAMPETYRTILRGTAPMGQHSQPADR